MDRVRARLRGRGSAPAGGDGGSPPRADDRGDAGRDESDQAIWIDCRDGVDSQRGGPDAPIRSLAEAASRLERGGELVFKNATPCEGSLRLRLSPGARLHIHSAPSVKGVIAGSRTVPVQFRWVEYPTVGGKAVEYLSRAGLHATPLDHRPTQVFDADVRWPNAAHPNERGAFLPGVSEATAYPAEAPLETTGGAHLHLTAAIFPFSQFGVTQQERVIYRIRDWHHYAGRVLWYNPDTRLLGAEETVPAYYREEMYRAAGYRLMNALPLVDSSHEWFYDPEARQLYVWFDPEDLQPTSLEVSSGSTLIEVDARGADVIIEDLALLRAGEHGIYVRGARKLRVARVRVHGANDRGILSWKNREVGIEHSTLTMNNQECIMVLDSDRASVESNTLDHCGLMSTQRDYGQQMNGIGLGDIASALSVRANTISHSGYSAISVGSNSLTAQGAQGRIEDNRIDGSCLFFNDCGAIYLNGMGQGDRKTLSIANNQVDQTLGNRSGSLNPNLFVNGIYLDWAMSDVEVRANTVRTSSSAALGSVFVHGGSRNRIVDNLVTPREPDHEAVVVRTEASAGTVPQDNLIERNPVERIAPVAVTPHSILH